MKEYKIIEMAINYAKYNSQDLVTKVGAIIDNEVFSSYGTNRFYDLNGYELTELQNNRELKYKYIIHAEIDAINNNKDCKNSTIYVNYMPCINCANKIIESGIIKVVYKKCYDEGAITRWKDSWEMSKKLFIDNNVEVIEVS